MHNSSVPLTSWSSSGLMNLRQVVLGKVDQSLHAGRCADTAAVFAEHHQDILGVPATPGLQETRVTFSIQLETCRFFFLTTSQ